MVDSRRWMFEFDDGMPAGMNPTRHQLSTISIHTAHSPEGETMAKLLPQIQSPADLHTLSDEQLQALAQEMRDELVRVLSIRPAHFASNLGVVELCLALHLTFDFSQDRLIWDTGHQIYPHKLITGRYRRVRHDPHQGRPDGLPQPARKPLRPVHDRPRRLQRLDALWA